MTTLTLEQRVADAIEGLVASGRFQSPMDVVREAVATIVEREAILAELDEAIEAGIRSADAGLLINLDDASNHLLNNFRTTTPLSA